MSTSSGRKKNSTKKDETPRRRAFSRKTRKTTGGKRLEPDLNRHARLTKGRRKKSEREPSPTGKKRRKTIHTKKLWQKRKQSRKALCPKSSRKDAGLERKERKERMSLGSHGGREKRGEPLKNS